MKNSLINDIKKDTKLLTINESNENDNLHVQVYTNFEELQNFQNEWDEFAESTSAGISMTFDWCRIWWKYYGHGRKLKIYLFRYNQEIAGIIPIFIETVWLGPVKWRWAKIVGSDFTMEMIHPLICSTYYKNIICRLLEYLLDSGECDALYWGPLSEIDYSKDDLDELIYDHRRNYKIINHASLGCYTLFHLPDTLDSYLSSLSKHTRQNYRRRQNKLTKEHHFDFDICNNNIQNFQSFIKMHESQWESVNKLGHFKDWPKAEEFHCDLVKSHSQLNRLRLFCLSVDNEPMAYRYVYCFGKRYYSLLPARACGSQWDKYGLGRLIHVLTVEKAIEEKVNVINAGRGHYDHKTQLGGQEYPVGSVLIIRNRFLNIIRGRIFCFMSGLLHLLYYRIWFIRLAPKLPIKRRSLWKTWIRTRL